MKGLNIYKSIIANSPLGYAYHKMLLDETNKPCDFEYIEANTSYERLTGLKRSKIIGRKASEVIPWMTKDEFDWFSFFNDVATNNVCHEFNQYSAITRLWYKVYSFSPEKGFFVTVLAEISEEVFRREEGISQSTLKKTYQILRLKRIQEQLNESKKQLAESNRLLQIVLDTIPMPIFWKDLDSKHLGGNRLYLDDAGKQHISELVGKSDYDLPWKEYADKYRKDDHEIMSSGVSKINLEEYHVNAEGVLSWVRVTKVPMRDEKGEVFGIMGAYEDITERKLAERKLFYEKERLKITLHSIGDGVIATDREGNIELINKVAEKLTGWTQESARGRNIKDVFNIINEKTRMPCENPVEKVMKSGKIAGLANHTVLISKNGSECPIDDSAAPIMDKDGRIEGVVLVFRDVTEERARENDILYLSYHDSLTGLYNRRFFEEELKRMDCGRMLPLAIIMGDVNGLKFTNDVFGHIEGDRLLMSAASILQNACREGDVIARWGGDEFVVLLPKADEKAAREICGKIEKACSIDSGNPVVTSISLGYSVKVKPEQQIIKVLKNAEDSMYKKKFFENKSYRSSIIASIKKTLFEKDYQSPQHTERNREICYAIGKLMGLSREKLGELELLAALHDIGNITIADCILNKAGKLSEEEWREVKSHPETGFRIAQSLPELAPVAEYILAHQEHWDGGGYPRGLKGEDIPLLSRIVAVVSAFDAMTSERPYRRAMKKAEAVKEIVKNAGTQFDPEVVERFLKVMEEIK